MAIIKKAEYKVFNGIDCDAIHFKSDADLIEIADINNIINSTNVENALQEIVQNINSLDFPEASITINGLMSSADKIKLDGITGTGSYILPVASTVLGGIKTGTDITIDVGGNVSVVDNSHLHTKSNISDFAHTHLITDLPVYPTALPASSASLEVVITGLGFTPYNATNPSNFNNYIHPANHIASIITQDVSNRFVTDIEKATWNSKEPAITKATSFNVAFDLVATNIKMDGTRSLGLLGTLARTDHVHASDTTKASATQMSDITTQTTISATSNVYTLSMLNSKIKKFKITTADTVAKTIAITNITTDCEVTIKLVYTNAAMITFPIGVVWRDNVAPTFTVGKIHFIYLITDDSGTSYQGTWTGAW